MGRNQPGKTMRKFLGVIMMAVLAFPGPGLAAEEKEAKNMDENELLATADGRIEQIRKSNVTLNVTDGQGKPVPGAKVTVEQTRHSFLFGANIFGLYDGQGQVRKEYARAFEALFNYATLPFYWGGYERQQGQTREDDLKKMAAWCRDHGIVTKGHPLVWHEVYPGWAPRDAAGAKSLLEARVREIVARFKGLIDRWDVVNEALAGMVKSADNGEADWIRHEGPLVMVGTALDWAHE